MANEFGEDFEGKIAALALPILVRQAHLKQVITYGNLAKELNPIADVGVTHRNVARGLGRLWWHLNGIPKGKKPGKISIPPIQCLVVRMRDRFPGEGIPGVGHFWYSSAEKKRKIHDEKLSEIYNYAHWQKVLKIFRLSTDSSKYSSVGNDSSLAENRKYGNKGESPEHMKLKNYVAKRSELFGFPKHIKGTTEEPLCSGDRLDVSFDSPGRWLAVEVKSKISKEHDLHRGLYQCIKYQEVMEKMLIEKNGEYFKKVEVILALEESFPSGVDGWLDRARNILNVRVVDNIRDRKKV